MSITLLSIIGTIQKKLIVSWSYAAAAFCFLAAAAANTSAALKVPSIACTGHFAVHMPQPMHLSCAIKCCFLGSPLAALTGQTLAHIWHPMHLSVTTALGLWCIKSTIARVGHTPEQIPHTLHLPISIRERLFSIFGASKGQTLTHFPHAIQPIWQFFRTSPPLSFEWHDTSTALDPGSTSMTLLGQAVSHFRHPVHLTISTTGMWVSLIVIAPKGQTRAQVP